MKNDTSMIAKAALAGVLAVGLSAGASSALAGKPGMEKCQGVVKAGKNDCGPSKPGCPGQAATDNAAEEWIYLPVGTCAKIAGGKVKS